MGIAPNSFGASKNHALIPSCSPLSWVVCDFPSSPFEGFLQAVSRLKLPRICRAFFSVIAVAQVSFLLSAHAQDAIGDPSGSRQPVSQQHVDRLQSCLAEAVDLISRYGSPLPVMGGFDAAI
eukprot:scaffold502209_cov38-Prasinocladus_malaysianus.AAC.1